MESLAIAINHSRASGSARLVLIGIANHDGDGGAWPTLDTLARYAAVTRRNVIHALDKLEALGEIRRHRQQGGTAGIADHRRPNLYEFLLRCPADCDHTKNHRTRRLTTVGDFSTGVSLATPLDVDGVSPATREGVSPATPKPSLEPTPREGPSATTDRARLCAHTWRSTSIGDFCASCGVRRDGQKVIDWESLHVRPVRRSA